MAALTRLALPGLALVACVAGHPAAKAPALKQREVTVYDKNVVEPTHHVGPVIWQDSAGNPLSTGTDDILVLPTGAIGVAEDAPKGALEVASEPTTTTTMTSHLTTTILVAPATATVPSNSPKKASSHGNDDGSSSPDARGLPGVSYAPYRNNSDCKSQDEINTDFEHLKGMYSLIRIYGTDCDQVGMVSSAAQNIGARVFLGIWDINNVDGETQKIVDGINGNWDMVHTVGVGNELVNNGQATPEQVISSMGAARRKLRAAGWTGPVVAVDTFNAAEAHPELCDQSDYCAINAHAFFDSSVPADQAGSWLSDTVQRVRSGLASPNQKIIVTETGWPTQGSSNGLAVPSLGNQESALASIQSAFSSSPGDLILFSAFDDLWKPMEPVTFHADPYWGIGGARSASDV